MLRNVDLSRLYLVCTRVRLSSTSLATSFNAAVLMHLVIYSLIQEASMFSKKEDRRVITADSIREASEVGMPTSFYRIKAG